MDGELIFRISLAVIFLLVLAIRFYYMARALKASTRTMATSQLGTAKSFLIWGVVVLALFLPSAYIFAPSWLEWATLAWLPGLRWLGIRLGVLSVLLLFWVHQTLGQNLAMPGIVQALQVLVTAGPYRWVRHPMYTSFALIALASFLISANWVVAVAGFGYFAGALFAVNKEESTLIEKFGDAYRKYMRRMGGFLPRLGT